MGAPKVSGFLPLPSKARITQKLSYPAIALLPAMGKEWNMYKVFSGTIIALGLAGAVFAATSPVSAADVGVNVGPIGLGFTVGNGHYYDRDHHRQAYTYPSDWKTYHHPQSWYHSHPHWNTQGNPDWYRN
jgi:hypothetical protein